MICRCLSVCSSLQEQKEDLRRRLGCTTHKLQMRQYLETELRRAQDQLDKFTEKLRRSDNEAADRTKYSVNSILVRQRTFQ